MTKPIIYLDHAAATPVDPQVLQAMQPYFTDNFYNPSATYSAGLAVRKQLEKARSTVAHWLGARSSEITFTAGATEANNLAIHGIMQQFPTGNVVISSIEHESVMASADKYDCRRVAVTPDGRLDLQDLNQKIDDETVLVCIMYANNEIGTVQPIRQIANIINEKRQTRHGPAMMPLYFHSDAAQAANYLDLHMSRLGVDLMVINAGKIYGPKQSGALYVRGGIRLQPLIDGGGQEHGFRSGSENVAACIGIATALNMAQTMRHEEASRLKDLQVSFLKQLAFSLPAAVINGSQRFRLPNNIHLTLPGCDNERLLIQLDSAGILAAAGSACSAGAHDSSHVLKALGLNDEQARASLRFTLGRSTTPAMISHTVDVLKTLY